MNNEKKKTAINQDEQNIWQLIYLHKAKLLRGIAIFTLSVVIIIGLIAGIRYWWREVYNVIRWKEEILLHDGRVIVVERKRDLLGNRYIGQEPQTKTWGLDFVNPDQPNQKFHFSIMGGTDIALIDFYQSIPYVVAVTSTGGARYDYKCPDPPYVIFRYRNNQWQQINLKELPTVFIRTNTISSTYRYQEEFIDGARISHQRLAELIGNTKPEEYRKIIRPYGDEVKVGCERDRMDYITGAPLWQGGPIGAPKKEENSSTAISK